MENINLYKGDCLEVIDKLISENIQVDLTVTSPPYDNLRNYEDSLQWNEEIWKQVIERLYKITKNGGVVVQVVGDATIKGSETGTSFKQALYFKEVGFNIHDTMIWRKPNAPPQTKEGRRYTLAHEYMFVLTKGKIKTFNPIMVDCINAGKKSGSGTNLKPDGTIRTDRVEARKGKTINSQKQMYSVWDCSVNTKNIGHPAVFPEKLVYDHIISWSNEGDVVLDCFMGSGTTGKVAKQLKREFIGIEKVDKYFEIAEKRINNIQPILFQLFRLILNFYKICFVLHFVCKFVSRKK